MNHYFYSRISTIDQSSERQLGNFKKHPKYNSENVFIDKVQGNVPFLEREEASLLFEIVTSNNNGIIVIDSIDRLGRNLKDILNTIDLLTKNKIGVESLKEGFVTLLPNGNENPMALLLIGILGSVAELERRKIKERTKEGVLLAKAKGLYKGRKVGSKQTDQQLLERHKIIVSKLAKGLTIREIVSITGKSSATILKVKKVLDKRM